MDADEAEWFRFTHRFRPSTVATKSKRRTWRVKVVHHDHELLEDESGIACLGMIHPADNVIAIDGSRSLSVIHTTTLHEMSHAFLFSAWPADVPMSPIVVDLEEALIWSIAPALNRIARPQWPAFPPEVVALMTEARRRKNRRR